MRRGYMGHLTRIANTVVHNLEKGPIHTQISNLISGLWEAHFFYRNPHPTYIFKCIFILWCRAARGLQRALGNLCGTNTVRNQQKEYHRPGTPNGHAMFVPCFFF